MHLTEGMKWAILITIIVLVFIVTIAIIASSAPSGSQAEAVQGSAKGCPHGLARIEFREGSSEIRQVVCK